MITSDPIQFEPRSILIIVATLPTCFGGLQLCVQPALESGHYEVEGGVADAVRLRPEPGLRRVLQRHVQLLRSDGQDAPVEDDPRLPLLSYPTTLNLPVLGVRVVRVGF